MDNCKLAAMNSWATTDGSVKLVLHIVSNEDDSMQFETTVSAEKAWELGDLLREESRKASALRPTPEPT